MNDHKKTITCIVPFYNESHRITHTVNVLRNVPNIDKVILVNDCSTDGCEKLLSNLSKNTTLISLPHNVGKTGAIREGMRVCSSEYVLLFDADLQGTSSKEIHDALKKYLTLPENSMLIFQRGNTAWFNKVFHYDTLISGERIVPTKIFKKFLKNSVNGWQLELLLNQFFIDQRYQIFKYKMSYTNTFKYKKWNLLQALLLEMKTWKDMYTAIPIWNLLYQILILKVPTVK